MKRRRPTSGRRPEVTDAPDIRKTHVIRIVGTNKAGDVLQDIWADVERIDHTKSTKQSKDSNWQGEQRKLRWLDDPDSEEGVVEPRTRDGNFVGDGSRDVVSVKVCSPDETDVNDPEEWIPIDVIKHMRSHNGDQARRDSFVNQVLNDARIVEQRRVFHRDASIDDAAQAAFDADPTRKVYVAPGSDYTFVAGGDDKTQYVEHEVIKHLKDRRNEETGTGNGSDQGSQVKMLNQYLIDQTDVAQLDVTGTNGFNPPYRLDPFQNIVNVQLAQKVIVVFVDFCSTQPRAFSVFKIIGDNVELLDDGFDIPVVNGGLASSRGRAYKVSANAGEFMLTTGAPLPGSGGGQDLLACVFAMDGSVDSSLARARAGVRLILPACFLEGHGSNDLPMQVDPPGLLWSVGAPEVTPGHAITWKLGRVKHRLDKETTPPNTMVQCYPVTGDYSTTDPVATWSGYQIRVYRLDRKGTDASFGGDLNPATDADPPGSRMDSVWHQSISSIGFKGIPFGKPPLISIDNPSG